MLNKKKYIFIGNFALLDRIEMVVARPLRRDCLFIKLKGWPYKQVQGVTIEDNPPIRLLREEKTVKVVITITNWYLGAK